MPIVVVASPKGGVGKTTVTASLAVALRSIGWEVLAIDLDPQNSLQLHFGLPPGNERGLGQSLLAGEDWRDTIAFEQHTIRVLPFGKVADDKLDQVGAHFLQKAPQIMSELQGFASRPDHFVIFDTSPGHSLYADKALEIADLRAVVLLTDAASYAVAGDGTAAGAAAMPTGPSTLPTLYILNQFDPGRRLSRDVKMVLEERFGRNFIGTVHLDQGVAEALAHQQSILFYDPDSRAAKDLVYLALQFDQVFEGIESRAAKQLSAGGPR